MKKLIVAIAIATLTSIEALAVEESVIQTKTVGDITYLTEWRYDLSDVNAVPRTATLLWAKDVIGENVAIPNIVSDGTHAWTVTRVADNALANNPGLISVTVPNTILEIGAYAFSNCTALTEITLEYGIRFIGERAFVNTIVREIKVPDSLLDMGGNISAGSLFTTTINIENSSHFKYSDDGVLYNCDMTTLYACPTRAEGTITIPNTVTTIAKDAFFGCHRLSNLEFAAALNTIKGSAFNVAGIWPGLPAPESTPKLKSVLFKGAPPNASDDIFYGAPDDLVVYAATDEWKNLSTWKGRTVSISETPVYDSSEAIGDITWSYHVEGGKATIIGARGETEVVTVPATLGGYVVSGVNSDALDGLSGVKAYKSESGLYKAKNGCLYSADETTLIRVPCSLVLPYSVTTEISSHKVTVTIIPGLKASGNLGNDGTSVTTNTTTISSSRNMEKIDGAISFDTLLSGVTTISDHAFYGCNSNLANNYISTSENLPGETGFIGSSGDVYVRTSKLETTTKTTYDTTLVLPATVKTVGANAFEGSGVVPSKTGVSQNSAAGNLSANLRPLNSNTMELEENSSYIGWIEQNGKIVGTVTVKTGKTRNGVAKTSGSVVKIGAKKTKIKNATDLANIDGLTLIKDLSAAKSNATIFNTFNGKCWTIALMTSGSNTPLLDGYTTLSIAAHAKGKVRITGTTADGTKISASAQMVVDGDIFKIPVTAQLYSGKRGGFSTVFAVTETGDISVYGASVDFTAILGGTATNATLFPIASAPRGNALSGDISIWGATDDGYSLAENLGWKPRYTKSSGQFKGSVNLINNSNGKRVRSTVTGVVVDGVGYGTAVVKGVRSWKVEVK